MEGCTGLVGTRMSFDRLSGASAPGDRSRSGAGRPCGGVGAVRCARYTAQVRTWQLVSCILAAATLSGFVSYSALRSDVCAALAPAQASLPQLMYLKSEHALCLFERDGSVHQWPASHGRERGKKRFEGDERTPEGRYTVSRARTSERYGLFLPISYPNAEDTRAAQVAGKKPGGSVGIHGPQRWYAFLGRGQALIDHSDGCIVLDRDSIHALARRVTRPTPIQILGVE
jgi:hypothetical protein